MIRLGVNVDHVATLRNARGESYPNPVLAAMLAEQYGADNITCHLREDRRHIRDEDLRRIHKSISIPLNMEMAATDEMLAIALELKPHTVTLVPEKRQERTTEGGLALDRSHRAQIERCTAALKGAGIFVVYFVEASLGDIELSAEMGAHAVELHTGSFCHHLLEAKGHKSRIELLAPFLEASARAEALGLSVHVGHGLNYQNAFWMQLIPQCQEANIGHAIVSHALFVGWEAALKSMKALLNRSEHLPDLGHV